MQLPPLLRIGTRRGRALTQRTASGPRSGSRIEVFQPALERIATPPSSAVFGRTHCIRTPRTHTVQRHTLLNAVFPPRGRCLQHVGTLPPAPDNVQYHVGLFADTLPAFLEALLFPSSPRPSAPRPSPLPDPSSLHPPPLSSPLPSSSPPRLASPRPAPPRLLRPPSVDTRHAAPCRARRRTPGPSD